MENNRKALPLGLLLLASPSLTYAMETVSVPEPSAFALLGIGLAGLVMSKCFKKKR